MSSPLDCRLHALDALRAGAMLLGVVLHAGLAFAPSWWFPFGRLAGHPAFDVLLEAIHGFRMELFFLLAGFFAERIARRDGVGGLLASRARRILAPLVVFALVVFAADLVFVRWCLVRGVTPAAPERWFWPRPYYLWFLYYLLFLEASFAGWSLVERFVGRSYEGWIDRLIPRAELLALMLVPAAAVLLSRHPRSPYFDWLPVRVWLLYYGLFFAAGVWLQRRPELLRQLKASAPAALAVALAAFGLLHAGPAGWARVGLTAAFAVAMTFGLLGAFQRIERPRPAVRYLADASYWVYLVHWPVVIAAQIALHGRAVPAGAGFLAVLALGIAVPLGSYALWVRGTWLDRIVGSAKAASPNQGALAPSAG